ncbi:hypothetical protein HD554DRAFT_2038763 [Boletus coccyginus]|nr:hypothetical protein HD554DRAFT_2038763 [Boletus coccyginus]
MQTITSIPVNEACCSGTDTCKCESKWMGVGGMAGTSLYAFSTKCKRVISPDLNGGRWSGDFMISEAATYGNIFRGDDLRSAIRPNFQEAKEARVQYEHVKFRYGQCGGRNAPIPISVGSDLEKKLRVKLGSQGDPERRALPAVWVSKFDALGLDSDAGSLLPPVRLVQHWHRWVRGDGKPDEDRFKGPAKPIGSPLKDIQVLELKENTPHRCRTNEWRHYGTTDHV